MKPSSSKGRNPGKSIKTSSSPVKPESPESKSNIVPYTGHSPIDLVNHYSALGSTPLAPYTSLGSTLSQIKPNYQSVLVNQYDPYKTDPSFKPLVNYKKSSPYFHRDEHFLFHVEPSMSHITNPISLVKYYFGPNSHYLPGKTLAFYKDILYKSESLSIKPIYDPKDPTKYYTIPST